MHINLESDYAARIVFFLAEADGRKDAQTIADGANVSPRFTLKIMRKLVAADIIRSYKGARGGYTLSRPAGEITLRQVIEAVEGPYRFSRCVDEGYTCKCSTVKGCPFHPVYDDITQMVITQLDQVTFGALLEKGEE